MPLNFTYPMGYPGGPGGGGGYVMGGSPAYGFSDPFSGFPHHVSRVIVAAWFFFCVCVFPCFFCFVLCFVRVCFFCFCAIFYLFGRIPGRAPGGRRVV